MASDEAWKNHDPEDGIEKVLLASWKSFFDVISYKFADYKPFIFRGQRKCDWPLEPSLDRTAKKTIVDIESHLKGFRLSARGRRGQNPLELNENEWWALGQHYGLDTPLLDWTESPYLALYFAFLKPRETATDKRGVFALSRKMVEQKSIEIAAHALAAMPVSPETVEIVTPLTEDNPRLVSQRGLFTRTPPGKDLETWVKTHFSGISEGVLTRIIIPEEEGDREDCLKALNLMNVNHLALFPDLSGSTEFCNMCLTIQGY